MMMEKPISNSSKSLVQNLPSIKMYCRLWYGRLRQ